MVGYYFEKKRAFATGIAVCGSGIGGFVFAPFCVYLINEYSWKGALWIVSGLVLNGVIFSCFYRPLPKRTPRKLDVKNSQIQDNGHTDLLVQRLKKNLEVEYPIYRCKSVEIKTCQNGNQLNCRLARSQDIGEAHNIPTHHKHRHVPTLNPLARKDIFYGGSLHHIPEYQAAKNECDYVTKMTIIDVETGSKQSSNAFVEFLRSILSAFDFTLMKSPTFVVYGISCFLCMFGK